MIAREQVTNVYLSNNKMKKHSDREREIRSLRIHEWSSPPHLRCGGDDHSWIGLGWVGLGHNFLYFFSGVGLDSNVKFTFFP